MANAGFERFWARATRFDVAVSVGGWVAERSGWLSWAASLVMGLWTYLANGLPLALFIGFGTLLMIRLARFERRLSSPASHSLAEELSASSSPGMTAPLPLEAEMTTPQASQKEIVAVDRVARAEADNAKMAVQIESKALRDLIAYHAQELREMREKIFQALRARNGLDILRESGAAATTLYDKMRNISFYTSSTEWLKDYAAWSANINEFYGVCMGWDKTIRPPFDVTPEDLDNIRGVPQDGIAAGWETQQRYRTMCVVQNKFFSVHDKAIAFIKSKGDL